MASYYLSNPSDESRPPTPEKGAKQGGRSRPSRGDSPRRSRRTSRAADSPRRGPSGAAEGRQEVGLDEVERLLLTGRADELKGLRSSDPEVEELLDTVPYIVVRCRADWKT